MRCYLVEAPGVTVYASTQADARAKRDELLEKHEGLKKKDVSIAEHEVPLAKAELISYLNNLVEPA